MTVQQTDQGLQDPNAPLERFLGQDLLLYGQIGNFDSNNEIQYARVRLSDMHTVESMKTWISAVPSAGGGGKAIRMGLYDQVDVTNPTQGPNNKVAQTASRVVSSSDNNTFVTEALETAYKVPETGFYWIALISTHASVDFTACGVTPPGFWPVKEESGSGDLLPASATGVNAETSVIYVAAVMEGTA